MARAWMKAALAGMAIMAMTAPVHAADTIKIGVPGAHSGDLVSYGMPSLNAAYRRKRGRRSVHRRPRFLRYAEP